MWPNGMSPSSPFITYIIIYLQVETASYLPSQTSVLSRCLSVYLDVRGKGLMVGVEFASPTSTISGITTDVGVVQGAPEKMASRVAKKCIEKGMLILTTSVYEVIRFIPPLNISEVDLEKGVNIFVDAVKEVVMEG